MKLKLFILTTFTIISLASCKKAEIQAEIPMAEAPAKVSIIEHYSEDKLDDSVGVFYDEKGRISKFIGFSNRNIHYGNETIKIVDKGYLKNEITVVSGRAIKAAESPNIYDEYTYNNSGYLVGAKHYVGVLKESYVLTYADGNLTKIDKTDNNVTRSYLIEHNADSCNVNLFTVDPVVQLVLSDFVPVTFLGARSKNSVAKISYVDTTVSGRVTFRNDCSTSYLYTKDANQNVSSVAIIENEKEYQNNVLKGNSTFYSSYHYKYITK